MFPTWFLLGLDRKGIGHLLQLLNSHLNWFSGKVKVRVKVKVKVKVEDGSSICWLILVLWKGQCQGQGQSRGQGQGRGRLLYLLNTSLKLVLWKGQGQGQGQAVGRLLYLLITHTWTCSLKKSRPRSKFGIHEPYLNQKPGISKAQPPPLTTLLEISLYVISLHKKHWCIQNKHLCKFPRN